MLPTAAITPARPRAIMSIARHEPIEEGLCDSDDGGLDQASLGPNYSQEDRPEFVSQAPANQLRE